MNAAQEETVQDPRKNRKLPRQLLSCTKCRERKVKVRQRFLLVVCCIRRLMLSNSATGPNRVPHAVQEDNLGNVTSLWGKTLITTQSSSLMRSESLGRRTCNSKKDCTGVIRLTSRTKVLSYRKALESPRTYLRLPTQAKLSFKPGRQKPTTARILSAPLLIMLAAK